MLSLNARKRWPTKEVRHTTFKAVKMNTTEVLQIMYKKNSKCREANQFQWGPLCWWLRKVINSFHPCSLWHVSCYHPDWKLLPHALDPGWPSDLLWPKNVRELLPCDFWACIFCPHFLAALSSPCAEAWTSSLEDERESEITATYKLPDMWVSTF